MYIIGNSKMDNEHCINVGVFGFKEGDTPAIAIDVGSECIRIFGEDDTPDFMKECKCSVTVDDGSKIIVPQWIIKKQQLDEESNLDLVLGDEGEKFIIKVTKNIPD